MPQALRRMVPPIVSQFISLLKDTSLVVVITLPERVALFNEDRLVDTINLKEGYILKVLYEKIRKGIIEIDLNVDREVSIQNLSSNAKFKPKKTINGYKFNVSIKMDGRVMEGEGLDLTQKKNIEKIEKKTEKMLEKEALALLEKLQKLNVDPLGIKEELRQAGYKDWKKQYGSVQFEVDAAVHLIQAGIME